MGGARRGRTGACDLTLSIGQHGQEPPDLRGHRARAACSSRGRRRRIGDAVAQGGITLAPPGGQRQRLAGERLHSRHLRRRDVQLPGQLDLRGSSAQLGLEPAFDGVEPAPPSTQTLRQADRPRSSRDTGLYGLPDPPGAVGREAEPFGVVELGHGPDETDIPLLNEVEKRQPRASVPLGDGNHQGEVGPDQLFSRHLPLADAGLEFTIISNRHGGRVGTKSSGGVGSLPDGEPQALLVHGGEKAGASDLDQIEREQVARDIVLRRSASS